MALEFNITPEDIEKLVKDSIMKSGFGKTIEEAIKKAFSGYDNPIDKEIKNYVGQMCSQIIREKFAPAIKEAVSKEIEARVTQEIIDKTVSEAVKRMERAAEESRY